MAQIVITLNKRDIADLMLGSEIDIKTNMQKFDNLTGVIIKLDENGYSKAWEGEES